MRGWGLFFFLTFLLLIFAAIAWVIFTQLRARRSGLPPPSWRSYVPFLKSDGGGGGFANLPSPRSSSPLEWIKDKINTLRQGRTRTAPGHYEGAGGYDVGAASTYGDAGSRRARGLDSDEAWDTRVENEADAYGGSGPGGYYEEQELGLAPTPYPEDPHRSHKEATMPAYGEGGDARGRSKSRDPPGFIGGQQGLDTRYDQGIAGSRKQQQQQRVVDPRNPFSDAHEAASLRGVSPGPMLDSSAGSTMGKADGGNQADSPTERKSMFRESL